jgi:hypothetical protein
MCRVPQAGGDDTWYSFNDEQVARVSPNQVRAQLAFGAQLFCSLLASYFFVVCLELCSCVSWPARAAAPGLVLGCGVLLLSDRFVRLPFPVVLPQVADHPHLLCLYCPTLGCVPQVVSQYAYILFYVRSRASTAAHHRRNHSAASAGGQ